MISALNRKLLRDLWHIKGQLLAISLVLGAGLAMLVMSVGLIASLDESRRAFYERQRFGEIFVELKRAPQTVARQIGELPDIAAIQTRVRLAATLDVPGMIEPATAIVMSVPDGGMPAVNALRLRQGRMPTPYSDDEAVISETFAQAHGFRPGDRLFAILNGVKKQIRIVGIALSPEFVYSLPPGGLFPDDRRFGIVWMGREALEAAHDMEDAFNSLSLTLRPGAPTPAIIEKIDRSLEPYGAQGAYGREDQISNVYVENEMDQLRAMAYVAPAIFLVVAAFLINTVMTRLIDLERQQIGTLKALGLSGGEVAWHYAKFALAISAVGLALGLIAGIRFGSGMAEMYLEFFRFPELYFVLPISAIALAVLISVLTTLGGVIRPIRRATALPPAEAMRPEAPPSYTQSRFETLFILRWLSPLARMVYRHLERRTRRAVLTTAGIAAGLGMLIGASFSLDSIDHIMHVQFDLAAREDADVAFAEPRGPEALDAVAAMPGVLRVEGYRSVPARLRNGNRVELGGVLGMSDRADLHRILDMDLAPITAAPEGVMLSDMLAELLDIRPGQMLRVEVMEGRQPTVELRVSGTFQEYIGTTALMRLEPLNAIMGDGPRVSGAWVALDPSQRRQFYDEVKNTPMIAGISIASAARQSFNDILAENLIQMTLSNIAFAAIIAFGVVYNSARISLSERARELASMRILGFTRGEISTILLGELAFLSLLAIPLGWLFGYGLAMLISIGLKTELFRIPVVIDLRTYGWATLVVMLAAAASALVVRRRLDRLNLIEVLKTRE